MALMDNEQFAAFFGPYARNVEGFYEAAYWRLSDEVIKGLVRRHLRLRAGDRVLDVGGGTARWAIWLATEFGVSVTVADKSEDMLRKARENLETSTVASSIELVWTDIENATDLQVESYDAVISTYGVLSFLNDPVAGFRTVHRSMRPGAAGLLMSHSLTNALSSKICGDGAGVAELEQIHRTRLVRWAPHVPPLRVFTSADLVALAESVGLATEGVYGVTSLAHPGAEDFGYPYQTLSAVSRSLEDHEYFETVLALELWTCEHGFSSERGVNLVVKVRRPAA